MPKLWYFHRILVFKLIEPSYYKNYLMCFITINACINFNFEQATIDIAVMSINFIKQSIIKQMNETNFIIKLFH